MRAIPPNTGRGIEAMVAEHQDEYETLPAEGHMYPVLLEEGEPPREVPVILTRWQFSEQEKARIAAGEDLYLAVLTFGRPLQPLLVQVGPEGWTEEACRDPSPS